MSVSRPHVDISGPVGVILWPTERSITLRERPPCERSMCVLVGAAGCSDVDRERSCECCCCSSVVLASLERSVRLWERSIGCRECSTTDRSIAERERSLGHVLSDRLGSLETRERSLEREGETFLFTVYTVGLTLGCRIR